MYKQFSYTNYLSTSEREFKLLNPIKNTIPSKYSKKTSFILNEYKELNWKKSWPHNKLFSNIPLFISGNTAWFLKRKHKRKRLKSERLAYALYRIVRSFEPILMKRKWQHIYYNFKYNIKQDWNSILNNLSINLY